MASDTKLSKMFKSQVKEMFNDYRLKNKVSDENKLRKSMIFSIMKVYMDELVSKNKTIGESITIVTNLVNEFAASDPDYLPASYYKSIIKKIKEYSVSLRDGRFNLIDNEFIKNVDVSKDNPLLCQKKDVVSAVCEGYRKEILDKFYKSNNDMWFRT